MPYCTMEDIEAVLDRQSLIRYTDDDDTGSPGEDIVNRAIIDADGLIDSFVSSVYRITEPIPALLTALSVDIAVYRIASRRGDAPEEFRKRYEDAVQRLQEIASGKSVLPGCELIGPVKEDSPGAAAIISPAPVFSGAGEGLKGFL